MASLLANGSARTGRANARPMTGSAPPDDRLREAIHGAAKLDCVVAEFIIGPAEGGTRWLLAMTACLRDLAAGFARVFTKTVRPGK